MSKRNPAIAVCVFDLSAAQAAGGAIQLFPAGQFDAPRGALRGVGPWFMDEAAASALIANTSANRKNKILVDYEHQSLLTAQNGQPAPAAGWTAAANLEWRGEAGLWGSVEWTERAAAHIGAKEYLYISPVFTYDTQTGRPLELLSAALTNNPAIDGMAAAAVAAATAALSTATPETVMDADDLIASICYLLNLPLTSSKEEVLAQIDKMKEIIAKAPAEAAATGLFGVLDAKDAEIAALKSAASSAAAPDPAQFVPMTQYTQLQGQVAALTAKVDGAERESLMAAALGDGRILPAQEAYWRAQPLAALTAYLDVAQPVAALSGTQTGGKPPVGAAQQQTSDDMAVMKALGLTAEQFAAGKVEV